MTWYSDKLCRYTHVFKNLRVARLMCRQLWIAVVLDLRRLDEDELKRIQLKHLTSP